MHSLLNRIRIYLLRSKGIDIDQSCKVGAGCSVIAGSTGVVVVGPTSELQRGVIIEAYRGRVAIASNVFLGPYTLIYGHGGVTIGDGTLIAMHCRILSSNHTIPARGTPIRSAPDILLPTSIGRDVWLGAGVTVLGGVTIGDCCVVGAGAVVTADLPPGSISVGIPAKIISYRAEY